MASTPKTAARSKPTRRSVIRDGALWLLPAAAPSLAFTETEPSVRFGLITDPHAADKKAGGSRHYRESDEKMTAAIAHFNKTKCDAAVCLGDIIDRAELEMELGYLEAVENVYKKFRGDRYYVFGNHCIDTLTKDEFIERTAKTAPFESFDRGGWHFVILDSCFTSEGKPYGRRNFRWTDANIPADELKWLAADLKATRKPTVVFAHQCLDRDGAHAVNNAPAVREVIAKSGVVRGVFQGHAHQNKLVAHNGIPYVTLRAMVEGPDKVADNAYSTLTCHADGSLKLDGFAQQTTWPLAGS